MAAIIRTTRRCRLLARRRMLRRVRLRSFHKGRRYFGPGYAWQKLSGTLKTPYEQRKEPAASTAGAPSFHFLPRPTEPIRDRVERRRLRPGTLPLSLTFPSGKVKSIGLKRLRRTAGDTGRRMRPVGMLRCRDAPIYSGVLRQQGPRLNCYEPGPE